MPRKKLTKAQQVLKRSKWYRPPTRAQILKGHKSSAAKMTREGWNRTLELPPERNGGYVFPMGERAFQHIALTVPEHVRYLCTVE